MAKFIGEKYEATKSWDIVQIAKAVRKDLEEAFPDYKFKVQSERYSMGQSLHIQVNNTGMKNHSHDDEGHRAIQNLKTAIRQVAYAYNYDDSDYQSDHFATKFYANEIRFES